MKVIGLCGGSGSGKSTVARLFAQAGIPVIDADAIYHGLTDKPSPCLDALVAEFSPAILNAVGTLDRPKLAAVVFADAVKRKTLNEITHAFVLSEMRRVIGEEKRKGSAAVLCDVPLLFESGFDRECDLTIAVTAPLPLRTSRIMERDGIGEEQANARLAAQISDGILKERCDVVIENDGDLDALSEKTKKIIANI